MTKAAIPVLSLSALPLPDLASQIGQSVSRFGFAIISDHDIDQSLIEAGWDDARRFFALPEAVKRAYAIPGLAGQRGYTPFGVEIAKGAQHRDLKEFWHVGRPHWSDPTLVQSMPANVWPAEIHSFTDTMTQLFEAFERCGARVLSAIAVFLGLSPDWFDDAIHDGNSILRILHYPPLTQETPAIRAEAHEDINLITLLLGAEEAGLQLLGRDGRWLDIDPPPGSLVINIGDMLQRLTNHLLPSTTHRVINPTPERVGYSRYSMPFFLHLRPDFLIKALPQCVDADHPRRDPPITAADYLAERLREIGLS